MSLHDRIMGLPNDKDANLAERVGFRVAQKEAAILSKEADELMAEMVEFLQCCNFDNNTDMREADALVRKYKEQSNEQ